MTSSLKRKPWGGSRAGAGAPQKFGEKTKVVRLPQSIKREKVIEVFTDLPDLIAHWKSQSKNTRNWVEANRLIAELETLMND